MKILGYNVTNNKTIPKSKPKQTALEKFIETKKLVMERQNTINSIIPLIDNILEKHGNDIFSVIINEHSANIEVNIKSGRKIPPIFCMIEQAGFKGTLTNVNYNRYSYSMYPEKTDYDERITISKN